MQGQCHCGAIRAEFLSARGAEALQVRSCQCAFCARHGAMTVSDPEGRATFTVDARLLATYQFATNSGEILLCARCGVYAGVVLRDAGKLWATLNARGLAIPEFAHRSGEPVAYDAETPQARVLRRKARWTPATIVYVER
jgi:hypothetical protein